MATEIQKLIDNSIRMYPGIIAVWPQHGNREEKIHLDAATFNGSYAVNNATLAFVADYNFYVTPATMEALKVLRVEGFERRTMYVPFSNGDYPKREVLKWRRLCKMAEKSWKEEFEEECKRYCDYHGIGSIDDEILENCFKMPRHGIAVRGKNFETKYYPEIIAECLDSVACGKIGTFSRNNGKVVFVYLNGKTYVAKGYKIIKKLEEAGYKEGRLFVPFSNGEMILNACYRAAWDKCLKW